MFDFGTLPPEVNSARMYSGPGSGPMMAAAAAWDTLSGQLESVATGYSWVVSTLQGHHWWGPASAAMASAAAAYIAWASAAAVQTAQTATQIRAAATAYETAFVATVPPMAVAANRTQLATLVATNFFGQNAPAIAATEALYAEMWAQDATAMYGYAGAAAEASTLTPYQRPPETTNPGGQAAAEDAEVTVTDMLSAVPQRLQTLTAPEPKPPPGAGQPTPPLTQSPILAPVAALGSMLQIFSVPQETAFTTGSQGIFGVSIQKAHLQAAPSPGPLGTVAAYRTEAPEAARLVAGSAAPVGKLSVPHSWLAAAQEANPAHPGDKPRLPGAAPMEATNSPKPRMDHAPMSMMGPVDPLTPRGGTPVFRMRDRRFRMPRPPSAG